MKEQKSQNVLNMNYLPREPQLRNQLKQAIDRYRTKLQKQLLKETQKDKQSMTLMQQLQNNIQKLQLRVRLIDDCSEISILRLDHLQQIFKHYCTHIFRTGSHMTFERLEYEKVHLTMDRFFLFVKDFELTTMMGQNNKKQDVLEKQKLILMFKKISSNTRDVTFEQFIHCLDKMAVMYYDEKQVFYDKKQAQRLQKQKRKKQFEKRKKQRLIKAKKNHSQQQNQNLQQNENGSEGEEDEPKKNIQKQQQQKQEAGQQNDDLVKDMINDKQLQDPNQQVNKITNRYAFEEQEQQQTPTHKSGRLDNVNDELFLILTNQQKIQLYYQNKIKVDSVKDYRQKLTNLNLTIFQRNTKEEKSRQKNKTQSKQQRQLMNEDLSRAEELKKKMEEKKLKQKASPIPKHKDDGAWARAEQQKRKKRQLKKQREVNAKKKSKEESDAILQRKKDTQKVKQKTTQRQTYNQNQVDWNMLGKISIDQLKIKQFNPNRYFNKDDDDRIFLDEYEGGSSRPRIMSGMEVRQRNSIAIVEDMKKRVGEVQKKQKREQRELDNLSKKIGGQNMPIKSRF